MQLHLCEPIYIAGTDPEGKDAFHAVPQQEQSQAFGLLCLCLFAPFTSPLEGPLISLPRCIFRHGFVWELSLPCSKAFFGQAVCSAQHAGKLGLLYTCNALVLRKLSAELLHLTASLGFECLHMHRLQQLCCTVSHFLPPSRAASQYKYLGEISENLPQFCLPQKSVLCIFILHKLFLVVVSYPGTFCSHSRSRTGSTLLSVRFLVFVFFSCFFFLFCFLFFSPLSCW